MITAEKILLARILIVDDQELNVILLQEVLRAAGYSNLLSVTDSRLVVDLVKGFQPDLLLLDLHMPYLDGFAILELLRKEVKDEYIPVLVLTADITHSTRIRALDLGAKDFLTKPFDRLEVLNRIRNMLEVRLSWVALRDQNAILEEKVRERTRELSETRLEIIHRLGLAAEFRDQGTGMHLLRISQFSHCLARAAGLSSEMCDLVLSASPMHDIGKIGIPDRILFKPGKLDSEEWAIMRTHTTIGAELLSGHDSALMRTAAQIALTHHERWDGSGYPHGLKGEEIPLEGRIVSLCDVFDALISKRPYKEKWSVDEAVKEVEAGAGADFEPALVACFSEALPEICGIIEQLESRGPAAHVYRV
jgi:putative two-component system response regulator